MIEGVCLLKSIDAGGRKAMDGAMQGRKRSGKIKRKRVAHRRECELLTPRKQICRSLPGFCQNVAAWNLQSPQTSSDCAPRQGACVKRLSAAPNMQAKEGTLSFFNHHQHSLSYHPHSQSLSPSLLRPPNRRGSHTPDSSSLSISKILVQHESDLAKQPWTTSSLVMKAFFSRQCVLILIAPTRQLIATKDDSSTPVEVDEEPSSKKTDVGHATHLYKVDSTAPAPSKLR